MLACFMALFVQMAVAQLNPPRPCLTCHDFGGSDNGWWPGSPTGGCYLHCTCATNCASGIPPRYLAMLQPGLTTEQRGGRLYVASVVAGGPAGTAGVRVGDEITLVNGTKPATSCAAITWESPARRGVTEIGINRDGQDAALNVRLQPVGMILANAGKSRMLPGGGTIVAASYTAEQNPGQWGGPYTLGLRWNRRGGQLVIAAVLYASPAYLAGLSVGDAVTAIDGTPVAKAGTRLLSSLRSADRRINMTLRVVRRGVTSTVSLSTKGLSQILCESATQEASGRVELTRLGGPALWR